MSQPGIFPRDQSGARERPHRRRPLADIRYSGFACATGSAHSLISSLLRFFDSAAIWWTKALLPTAMLSVQRDSRPPRAVLIAYGEKLGPAVTGKRAKCPLAEFKPDPVGRVRWNHNTARRARLDTGHDARRGQLPTDKVRISDMEAHADDGASGDDLMRGR